MIIKKFGEIDTPIKKSIVLEVSKGKIRLRNRRCRRL